MLQGLVLRRGRTPWQALVPISIRLALRFPGIPDFWAILRASGPTISIAIVLLATNKFAVIASNPIPYSLLFLLRVREVAFVSSF